MSRVPPQLLTALVPLLVLLVAVDVYCLMVTVALSPAVLEVAVLRLRARET